MRPLPISLQARMNLRDRYARWVDVHDLNRVPDPYGSRETLSVPRDMEAFSGRINDRIAQGIIDSCLEPRKTTSIDAIIEGLSATGIPVLSQVAGVAGVVWGTVKGAKAAFQFSGEALSAITALQPTNWARTGLSAIRSIALGMSTFFPPVGVLANVASAALSGINASVYLFVEPLTRASAKDIPELMSRLSKNPRDDRLKILLGSIGTSIVPAIKTILEHEDPSVEFKRALLSVLRYDLRYKRGESVSDLCPLVSVLLLFYGDCGRDLVRYVYADGGKRGKIYKAIEDASVETRNQPLRQAALKFLIEFEEE